MLMLARRHREPLRFFGGHPFRRLVSVLRDYVKPVRVVSGEDPAVRVLQGVKLYREVRIRGRRFIGSGDAEARPVDYVLDALPPAALTGKTVLDLGTAGGAVCFAAAERGCREATGIEIADWRIRGARAIKRMTRIKNVRFVKENFYVFLHRRRREFDVVFALNVLQHLANPFPLLRRICRASREYVVLEMPDQLDVEQYGEYNADLMDVEGARSGGTARELAALLAIYDFSHVENQQSSSAARFFRGGEASRSVYVFKRESQLKDRDRRLDEMKIYRESRASSFEIARADRFNIGLRGEDQLAERLRDEYPSEWIDGSLNFILAGPRASGKSHQFDRLGVEHHPAYNPKIFKFPNADGRHGLRRHLNPTRGQGRKFAQVLLGTLDDEEAHCTRPECIAALRDRPVVCLLLNVGFDEHFSRLYQREVDRFGTADPDADFDVSLRFDCARVVSELREAGIRYRVLTAV